MWKCANFEPGSDKIINNLGPIILKKISPRKINPEAPNKIDVIPTQRRLY